MMRKSIYFLMMFLGFALVGCEPMEDIHQEIDTSVEESPVLGVVDYTLTEEDYTNEDDGLGLDFPNFSSLEEAKTMVPLLLSKKYPVWGEGSLVNVTFDLYAPIEVEEYTVTASDYDAIGLEVDYFSDTTQVQEFLAWKYPQADEGSYVELTYQMVAEEKPYELSSEDYDLIGEEFAAKYPEPAANAAQYGSFTVDETSASYWSDAMILEAINKVLLANVEGVKGQTYTVTYDTYNNGVNTESMTVKFDGNAYVKAVAGTDYTFQDADYDLVGSELGSTYPGPAGNAAQYGSFDVNVGSDNYWSDAMLLEALNVVLEQRFSTATEGDQFQVEVELYLDGQTPATTYSIVYTGGSFAYNDEASISTVEQTSVFAFADGEWNIPLQLTTEDYTAMGQNYPNFSDEDEAIYKIGLFLEQEFPYAEEGDFVAVAYEFFDNGVTTEYANYVFENGEWNHIPSVIQQTLQFGHTGVAWEPDNTLRHMLTPEDYSYIATQLESEAGFELAAGNLAEYGNFNRAGGPTSWDDEMMVQAMRVLLNHIAPNAEVGQKYVLSFSAYVGGGYETQEMSFIKAEDGQWVLNN